LRSSIQQEHLNGLAIMSIVSEISTGSNLDKLLNDIANARARKISLSYQMQVVS